VKPQATPVLMATRGWDQSLLSGEISATQGLGPNNRIANNKFNQRQTYHFVAAYKKEDKTTEGLKRHEIRH